jgi:hypothetical protein
VIPAYGRPWQEDFVFKVRLKYIGKLYLQKQKEREK